MKRELIESCPDFPGHLAEEDLQDDLDQPDHIDHLAPGPLSIGAYFEKRWSGYQETFGSISMTEIVSGAHFPVSGAHF